VPHDVQTVPDATVVAALRIDDTTSPVELLGLLLGPDLLMEVADRLPYGDADRVMLRRTATGAPALAVETPSTNAGQTLLLGPSDPFGLGDRIT
jgi:hypothetical protein